MLSVNSYLNDIVPVVLILSVVGTILSLLLITPVGRREELPPALKVVHDIFNFRGLLLEKILKAFYIFTTIAVILIGFFMMFEEFAAGIVAMLLGPILLRIYFEFIMMFVILVKNTNEISNKIKDQNKTEE